MGGCLRLEERCGIPSIPCVHRLCKRLKSLYLRSWGMGGCLRLEERCGIPSITCVHRSCKRPFLQLRGRQLTTLQLLVQLLFRRALHRADIRGAVEIDGDFYCGHKIALSRTDALGCAEATHQKTEAGELGCIVLFHHRLPVRRWVPRRGHASEGQDE